MLPIGCPETSVRNYHYSLRDNPEECSSQVWHSSYSLYTFGEFCNTVLLWGHVKAEAVSRHLLTVEDRVQPQASSCKICGEQGSAGTDVSPSAVVLPFNIIPFSLHTHKFIYHRGCITPEIDSVVKQNT
jgi:hypothetical protein